MYRASGVIIIRLRKKTFWTSSSSSRILIGHGTRKSRPMPKLPTSGRPSEILSVWHFSASTTSTLPAISHKNINWLIWGNWRWTSNIRNYSWPWTRTTPATTEMSSRETATSDHAPPPADSQICSSLKGVELGLKIMMARTSLEKHGPRRKALKLSQ